MSVPLLPSDFSPRPGIDDEILGLLQNNRVVVVQGEGGLGKTVLASAAVQTSFATELFLGGVSWLTVGSAPNITSLQTRLAFTLGGSDVVISDEGQGRATLQKLLSNSHNSEAGCKKLLVLDDVWERRHADSLIVLADNAESSVTYLVTTRVASLLPTRIGVEYMYPLSRLSQAEARTLLSIGKADNEAALTRVINACERLPLALSMVAASEACSRGVTVLASHLDAVKIDDLPPSFSVGVYRALSVCTAELAPEDLSLYESFACFAEDTPVPVTVAVRFFTGPGEGRDAVVRLSHRKLIRLDGHVLTLHDLQLAFIQRRVQDVATLHRRLLRSYATECCDGDSADHAAAGADGGDDDGFVAGVSWWRAPADGYLHSQLHTHINAGCTPAVATAARRRLLLNFRWLRAKLAATGNDVGGVLGDFRSFLAEPTNVATGAEQEQAVATVAEAVEMSAHVVAEDARQLALQLLGRLPDTHRDVVGMRRDAEKQLRLGTFEVGNASGAPRRMSVFPPAGPHATEVLTRTGGPLKRTLPSHTDWVRTLCLSPDDRFLLSGSNDLTVKVWEVSSGALVCDMRGEHTGAVVASAFAPHRYSKRLAVTGAEDNTLVVWDFGDVEEPVCLRRCVLGSGRQAGQSTPDECVRSVAPLQHRGVEGQMEVAVAWGMVVLVYDVLGGGGKRGELRGHQAVVNCVSSSASHRTSAVECVVSGDSEGVVLSWDVACRTVLRRLTGASDEIRGVCVSADGATVVGGGHDTKLLMWELPGSGSSDNDKRDGSMPWAVVEPVRVLEGHSDWIHCVAMSSCGEVVVTGADDDTIRVWSVAVGTSYALKTFSGAFATAVTGDGRLCVSASGEIKQWSIEKAEAGSSEATVGHAKSVCVHGVALSADARRCVSVSSDGFLLVWSTEGGRPTLRVKCCDDGGEQPCCVGISDDGGLVAVGCDEGTLILFSISPDPDPRVVDARQRLTLHEDAVSHIRIVQHQGRTVVVTASHDDTIRISLLGTRLAANSCMHATDRSGQTAPSLTLRGSASMVTSLAVAVGSGGDFVVLGGDFEGKLCLWRVPDCLQGDGTDLVGEAVVAEEDGVSVGRIQSVALDSRGEIAVAVTATGLVRVHDLTSTHKRCVLSTHSGSDWVTRGFSIAVWEGARDGGDVLAMTATWDRQMQISNVKSGEMVARVRLDVSPVAMSLRQLEGGEGVLALGDADGVVHCLHVCVL